MKCSLVYPTWNPKVPLRLPNQGVTLAKGQYDVHSKRYGVGEAKATENKEQAHEFVQCLLQSSPKAHVTLFSALTFSEDGLTHAVPLPL